MAQWSRKKVNSENLNKNNEYTRDSQFAIESLNAVVNSGLYSQDFVEHLADTPDVSEAGNVGTPTVTLVTNPNATGDKPYKRFKFSNLKGEKGEKGDKGDKGEPGGSSAQINKISVTQFASLAEFRTFILQKKFENKFINLELINTEQLSSSGSNYARLITIKPSGTTITSSANFNVMSTRHYIFYPIEMNPGQNGEYINGSNSFTMGCDDLTLSFEDSNKINVIKKYLTLTTDSLTYEQCSILITSKITSEIIELVAYYLD